MKLMRDEGLLSENEAAAIVDGALSILENVGVMVENDTILKTLSEHGAIVDFERNVCRFSSEGMSDFLKSSERYEWPDTPVRFSGAAEIYQGWYLDPEDGRYLPWTEETLLDYVRLAKALPHTDGAGMLGLPLDNWPKALQPLTEKIFCWKWGIGGGSAIWETEFCPKLFRLWDEWANHTGRDIRTLFNGTVYLISPLKFARMEAEQFVWFAARGLEVHVGSLGSLGGTSPVTPAGALALQTAERFFLNFLRRAFFGHKDLRLGNSLSVIDMQTGCFQYGRPEQTLLNMAGAAVARKVGARFGGHGGLTDAREPGYEAAMQKISSAICNGQASGVGHIACGLLAVDEVFSPEQLVLDDEALGWLGRLSTGIQVDSESIAQDAIMEASWGGQYLSLEHTAEHFRESLWFPKVFSSESFSRWKSRKGRGEREEVRDRIRAVRAEAPELEPQISTQFEKKLWTIIEE
jgi:trimethylamine--corrinoid protein Co-methyltransferase